MRRVMGIDPALVRLGWAVVTAQGGKDKTITWQTGTIESKNDGLARLKEIRDAVVEIAVAAEAGKVVIENYSFGSKFQGPALGEVSGVVKLALFERGFEVVTVAPATLKKFVTGSGHADKPMVRVKILKRWKCEFKTQDEAEAYALARWGLENV